MNITREAVIAAIEDCGGSGTLEAIRAAYRARFGEVGSKLVDARVADHLLELLGAGRITRLAHAFYALPGAAGTPPDTLEERLVRFLVAAGRPVRVIELPPVAGASRQAVNRCLGRSTAIRRAGRGWYVAASIPLAQGWEPTPTPPRIGQRQPRPLPPRPLEPGTIAWHIEQFLTDITAAGKSSLTVITYKSLLTRHLVPLGLPIERITTDDLRPLLTGKPASRSTRRTVFDVFWKYAVKQGWCAENPVELLPRVHVDPPDRKPLTDDERAALYAAADDLDREAAQGPFSSHRLMLLLLDQGLRRKEAVGIRWCDVRWDAGCINVSVTKGRKRHAPIPLAPELRCALEEARPPDDAGTVLGIDDRAIYLAFKHIARRAGVDRAFPHLMRHTWATSYLLRGGSAFHLQTLGGWSGEKMIRERYGRHALERAALDEAHRINGENGHRQETAPTDDGEIAEAMRYLADPRIRAALLALGRAMKGGDHASA